MERVCSARMSMRFIASPWETDRLFSSSIISPSERDERRSSDMSALPITDRRSAMATASFFLTSERPIVEASEH
eukprot:2288918-Prymnesium_polylepis.1